MNRIVRQAWPAALMCAALAAVAEKAQAQTGACCLPAANNPCINTTAVDCANQGGTFTAGAVCAAPFANGGCNTIIYTNAPGLNGAAGGGQVNISGATLFVDFFRLPGGSNDFLNIDSDFAPVNPPCDSINGPFRDFKLFDPNPCSVSFAVDQLAPLYSCNYSGWWLLQYRSVGSVEGYEEFIDNQLTGSIPRSVPSERGVINTRDWAVLGVKQALPGSCREADLDGDGVADESGTPVIPNSIDIASIDVPAAFATRGTGGGGDAKWNRKPNQVGFGLNPRTSTTGASNLLASLTRGILSLNLNRAAPDGNTLYDTTLAWSPVCFIANIGTGLENATYTQTQYLLVAGRLPNGENLEAGCRDVGSGTRNAFANSFGVDPSWANGDNLGPRLAQAAEARVGVVSNAITGTLALPFGARTQPSNCGGSGIMEDAVQNRRLCVGHTGLFGASRAAEDSNNSNGRYEIVNIGRDVDANGNPIPGWTPTPFAGDPATTCPTPAADHRPGNGGYVRPTLNSVLDNADGAWGYQIGGTQSLVTRGDPEAGFSSSNPVMSNLNARDYVRNITQSVAAFVGSSGTPPDQNMPGELLTRTFVLQQGVDAVPFNDNPTDLRANPLFNQSVQDFIRCNNTTVVAPYGSNNRNGRVPQRNVRGAGATPIPGGTYSDGAGAPGGNVNYWGWDNTGMVWTRNVLAGDRLNRRNRLAGDFNNDGARNLLDVAKLMEALKDPRAFQVAEGVTLGTGGGTAPVLANDFVIPEVIGDFDSDGDFNAADARYFADGLAIDPATGKLNRKLGFEAVDLGWNTVMAGDNNYFNTQLATYPIGMGYKPGDSMADVAGNTTPPYAGSQAGPFPGAYPAGSDGIVNDKDIDYVYRNFGAWGVSLDVAVHSDLSCDMNGDLVIDQRDVDQIVLGVVCTRYGDVDLDGDVDANDITQINNHMGQPGGWAFGDVNGDGMVTAGDLALANANLGFVGPACLPKSCGDIDGDGLTTVVDQSLFVQALLGQTNVVAYVGRSDMNSDGKVNGADVQKFVCCLLGGACP